MENSVLVIFFSVIIVIIIISYFFNSKAIIKRKLRKAVPRRISDCSDGEVAKIVGTVEFVDEPLISPLSQRPCCLYYVHVEKKVSTKNGSSWRTVIEEQVSSKFVIRDGYKYAFVDDNNLKSYILEDREYSSGFMEDATKVMENYLRAHGYESEGFLGFNRTLRYSEGILEQGEEIAILGQGEWKYADQIGLPAEYARVLVMSATNEDKIYLSDHPDTVRKLPK